MMSQSQMGSVTSVRCRSLMLLGLLVSMMVGCGGGGTPAPKAAGLSDDQKAIMALVGGFADTSSNLKRLTPAFVKANAPKQADMAKFKNCSATVDGEIAVSGETATAPVAITKFDDNGNTSPPTKQTWKFQKEGGEWKFVETPI